MLDGITAQYDENFSNAIDGYDIHKMHTLGEEVSLKSAESIIVIERRAMIDRQDTLHLNMLRMRAQSYQWEINSSNMDYPGRTGFLIDRYLNTSTPLDLAGTTTVNFNVANIAGSYAADRFIIVFNQSELGPLPVHITTITASRKADKTIDVAWKVEDDMNMSNYELQRSADGNQFTTVHTRTALVNNGTSAEYKHNDAMPLASDNFYRIKANSLSRQVQYSAIVKVAAQKETPSISVYPNPVEGGLMQLRFSGQAAGRYQVQLSNTAGQVLYKTILNLTSATQSQQLVIPAETKGAAQLKITAPDGTVTVMGVLMGD